MDISQRISLFSALGQRISQISEGEFGDLVARTHGENNWFTQESIETAFVGLAKFLDKGSLEQWTSEYNLESGNPRNVGVVMAGNIPLVGFHDLLSVLISGHKLSIKASSDDGILMKWVVKELIELEPSLAQNIQFEERLNHVDAVIATGSDNSARYFEYYFSKKPHIIRKNRTSCAILRGGETEETIAELGKDMFTYFGLGCRNVSKLYLPKDYNTDELLDGLSSFSHLLDHHKYKNNYDYNKSIYLINGEPHLDTGFTLFRETTDLVSPIAVIFYQYYADESELTDIMTTANEKIQCVVGEGDHATVPFGQAQYPGLADYADGVDTLDFLQRLN